MRKTSYLLLPIYSCLSRCQQLRHWRCAFIATWRHLKSGHLLSMPTRYAQIEKECLANGWACERFKKYLVGLKNFKLVTDHKLLVSLMNTKYLDNVPIRCQRLLIRLMRFKPIVEYAPGKTHSSRHISRTSRLKVNFQRTTGSSQEDAAY